MIEMAPAHSGAKIARGSNIVRHRIKNLRRKNRDRHAEQLGIVLYALSVFLIISRCNKIALGHHFDDVIETILMGMLYGAQIQTMMPKLHSTNFEGFPVISI